MLSDEGKRNQLVKGEATLRSNISKNQRTYKKKWKDVLRSRDKDWKEMVEENGYAAARSMLGGRTPSKVAHEANLALFRVQLVKTTIPILKDHIIRRTAKSRDPSGSSLHGLKERVEVDVPVRMTPEEAIIMGQRIDRLSREM